MAGWKLRSWLYPVGRFLILPVLRVLYHLRIENAEVVRQLSPPYVVVGNHSTYYDGFFLACGISPRVHLLVTDSLLHGGLGFLIRRSGVVPMTKNLVNIHSIRAMLNLVEERKVIGMFPEGQTTWHGESGSIYPGVGKLIKLLGIPVVSATVRGGYHIQPKWSRGVRHGSLTVSYALALSGEDVVHKTADELQEAVQAAVHHDDHTYVRENNLEFPSRRGAEYLERALYHCPECDALALLHSAGNTLSCAGCGAAWQWNGRGELEDGRGGVVNLKGWVRAERDALAGIVQERLDADDGQALYPPDVVRGFSGFRTERRERLGAGTLTATPDRFVFEGRDGVHEFPFAELEACQVMEANQFEFYFRGNIYVFTFRKPEASGLKYLHILQVRNPAAAEVTW